MKNVISHGDIKGFTFRVWTEKTPSGRDMYYWDLDKGGKEVGNCFAATIDGALADILSEINHREGYAAAMRTVGCDDY